MVTPCLTTALPGLGQLAVAALLGRHVDDDASRLHRLHHLGGDELRRGLAGNQRRRDDDVDLARLLRVHLALRLLEAFAHDLGVAAAARALFLVVDLHELAAQRHHLVRDLGARVVGAHDRAQVGGRADRREPGDAGAGDEDLRRRDLAGGGDLPVEEAAERVGGLDDGAIAADAGHRRERIHLLGARSWRGRASIASTVAFFAASCCMSSGFCAGQMKSTSMPPSRISPTSAGVGGRTLKTMSDVGPQLRRRGHDVGARGAVGVVREVGGVACARLDGNAEAQLDQLLDDLRHGGDALLAREDFLGYANELGHAFDA